MKKLSSLIFLAIIILLFCTVVLPGCGSTKKIDRKEPAPGKPAMSVKYYSPTDEDFLNPERGIVKLIEIKAENTRTDISGILKAERLNNHSCMCQVRLRADKYASGPLPDSVLKLIDNLYSQARSAGAKMELRWSYTYTYPNGKDPSLQVILGHIQQLKPIWAKNADVFSFLDCGFFGPWGEQHSTDIATNPASVKAVVNALLEAIPQNRMLTLRYNIDKRLVTGTNIPLKRSDAFSGTPAARIGNENDCFLGNGYGGADVGSYQYYLHIVPDDTMKSYELQRNFLHHDNMYVPAFGEFCGGSGVNARQVLTELKRLRWDGIRDDWGKQYSIVDQAGLAKTLRRSLGYRFQLVSSEVPDSLRPGTSFESRIVVTNTGFGKLFNPRKVEVVLRNRQSGEEWSLVTDAEPRLWSPADTASIPAFTEWSENDKGFEYSVILSGGIPEGMKAGAYDVFINLPDASASLHDNPLYSIRLANSETWEPSTGYNDLHQAVVIGSSGKGEPYRGNAFFTKISDNQ